jgi:hypothetical protein
VWSALAVFLGKRAGLVSIVGGLITLILGCGLTKLAASDGVGVGGSPISRLVT